MPDDLLTMMRAPVGSLPYREALTTTSFNLPANLSPEEWATIGQQLGRMDGSLNWWIGDWWGYEGHEYGDRKAVVEGDEWSGPTYESCKNAATVCRAFEERSRRRDLLTFNHHSEVASLEDKGTADRLLDWCEETIRQTGKPRTIRALREEARKAKQMIAQGWTADQLDRKSRAEKGEAVVANMREGKDGRRVDEALLTWAEGDGRLLRIDRQSDFGNPFVIPDDGDRGEVVEKFAKFYWPQKPKLLGRVPDLNGAVLMCWCHPEECHGHIIAETINRVAADEGTPEEVAESIADSDG